MCFVSDSRHSVCATGAHAVAGREQCGASAALRCVVRQPEMTMEFASDTPTAIIMPPTHTEAVVFTGPRTAAVTSEAGASAACIHTRGRRHGRTCGAGRELCHAEERHQASDGSKQRRKGVLTARTQQTQCPRVNANGPWHAPPHNTRSLHHAPHARTNTNTPHRLAPWPRAHL